MRKVCIKYNPYLISTEITVDGQQPKENSSLNVSGQRLQEWVDNLPKILIDEFRETDFEISYHGLLSDYEDLKMAVENDKEIVAKFNLVEEDDVSIAEKKVNDIFEEIQNGPIEQLKDKSITDAFEKAQDQKFEVNVVATVSSGKSTLINALLKQQLMPTANKAKTATIVRILDTDTDRFSAIAYDKSGNEIFSSSPITYDEMKIWNDDERIAEIHIKGNIPFIKTGNIKLVLVDTPGPNNSRNSEHKEKTYRMLQNSDKSLVLFVVNSEQNGITDEKMFLDEVCRTMKEEGKQSRDRFIIAVNRLDNYDPENEGENCITEALDAVKKDFEGRNICMPNIFPVSALVALEKRIGKPKYMDIFRNNIKVFPSMHFDNYYNYSHLPQSFKKEMEEKIQNANEEELIEIHSGIFAIEQAINLYINKYARTTKIRDLVESFNGKLSELAAVEKIKDAIRKDQAAKEAIDKNIEIIQANIRSAEQAQTLSKKIDGLNLTRDVENQIKDYRKSVERKLDAMYRHETKMPKYDAINICEKIQKECKELNIQIKVKIEDFLQKSFRKAVNDILNEYKKHLSLLNVGIDTKSLDVLPLNLVASSLTDLDAAIEESTMAVREKVGERTVMKEIVSKKKKTNWFWTPWNWGTERYETFKETKPVTESVYESVDYVDMQAFSDAYLDPFVNHIQESTDKSLTHVKSETERLKKYLKEKLAEIDDLLKQKLSDLKNKQSESQLKQEEVAKKEADLKWLLKMEQSINEIINF